MKIARRINISVNKTRPYYDEHRLEGNELLRLWTTITSIREGICASSYMFVCMYVCIMPI